MSCSAKRRRSGSGNARMASRITRTVMPLICTMPAGLRQPRRTRQVSATPYRLLPVYDRQDGSHINTALVAKGLSMRGQLGLSAAALLIDAQQNVLQVRGPKLP